MDKKNTLIGVLLLIAAGASFFLGPRTTPQPARAPVNESSSAPALADAAPAPAPSGPARSPSDATLTASASAHATPADYTILANAFIEVRFTNHGGAIDRVALLKKADHLNAEGEESTERYMLNTQQAAPALSLTDFPGADRLTAYTVISKTDTEVVYRAVTDTLEITRTYSLAKAANRDDYQVRHETTFRNLSDKPLALPRAVFNLGTATPLNASDLGMHLNTGYSDGEDSHFIARSDLEGGGFLSWVGMKDGTPPPYLDKPAAIKWASVKNQFFVMILTPDQPGNGVRIERTKVVPAASAADNTAYGITGYAQFDLKTLAAGASSTFGANYFVGPKEYKRLSNLDIFKHDEAKVMQFDSFFFNKIFFSGFFAPLLLTMMTWFYSILGNWGWAIVITTLVLKIVFLPLTLAASRSAKRMAKLNPLMQAMREKYKDNPQKIQSETLRLFKENKVNPVGGCIPILITIPFFVGFFSMLQSASDLRFASFLWANDLAAADTIGHIWGFPINIMPILMGATTIIQMRLTPMPSADNAQATMMKIMPWIMMVFFYTFPCGLALYSTINGLFTIGQQLIINRMPEPELPGITATTAGAKPTGSMKNVTPKKK